MAENITYGLSNVTAMVENVTYGLSNVTAMVENVTYGLSNVTAMVENVTAFAENVTPADDLAPGVTIPELFARIQGRSALCSRLSLWCLC